MLPPVKTWAHSFSPGAGPPETVPADHREHVFGSSSKILRTSRKIHCGTTRLLVEDRIGQDKAVEKRLQLVWHQNRHWATPVLFLAPPTAKRCSTTVAQQQHVITDLV